jgi:hypothetical protein
MKVIRWVFILGAVLSMGSCRGCQRAVADYSGDVEEIWQVQGSGARRISNYEWFEGKYQSIEGEKINVLLYASRGEDVTDQIVIVNRWISEYNARSREYTRAMWKSDNLPYQLELIRSVEDLK